MSPRALLVSAPFIFLLSACQQAAWKAGASADDFKREEQVCREQMRDEAAAKQCLRDKGWTVADFNTTTDDSNMAETTTPTAQPSSTPHIEIVRQPSPAHENPQPAIESPAIDTSKTEKPTSLPDPLQKQSVQTWWKAGAQAADLQIDANICLTTLGEQHAPDYSKHLYTRAIVSCLRERGWYAGHDPVYTPLR